MPDINLRIGQLIDYKCNGNRTKFAETANIPQQSLNRLFNIDTRTKKYPTATTEILIAITEMFVDVNPEWLLAGRGEMFKKGTDLSEELNRIIELATRLGMQIKENEILQQENFKLLEEINSLKKTKP